MAQAGRRLGRQRHTALESCRVSAAHLLDRWTLPELEVPAEDFPASARLHAQQSLAIMVTGRRHTFGRQTLYDCAGRTLTKRTSAKTCPTLRGRVRGRRKPCRRPLP